MSIRWYSDSETKEKYEKPEKEARVETIWIKQRQLEINKINKALCLVSTYNLSIWEKKYLIWC